MTTAILWMLAASAAGSALLVATVILRSRRALRHYRRTHTGQGENASCPTPPRDRR